MKDDRQLKMLDDSAGQMDLLGSLSGIPDEVRSSRLGSANVPVVGAWVRHPQRDITGRVVQNATEGPKDQVCVQWFSGDPTEWIPVGQLRSGFQVGLTVQDTPRSGTRRTLGEGIVIETRSIGHRDQVLVEFPDSGDRIWLPWENIRQIKGVDYRFIRHETGSAGEAERFRLRCLAHALDMWNQNTGALSRLDVDPLPHQIHLVHHILASGNLNWMIADDVGLGKTIEVGMLLSALKGRNQCRRILLITPAGLVRQWQDELALKFGMDDFEIYGTDFHVRSPRQWKMHDHVIGSIDRFKSDTHLEKLLEAGDWDLVVFDEAHRLSRRQYGTKFEAAERFKLAAALRQRTANMILLTGTPHQGMHDKFQALLELLRPDLLMPIRTLSLNPEILNEMVIRNQKADVTDAEGNFIFQGKTVKTIDVGLSGPEREFDQLLQDYLWKGYRASKGTDQTLRAIGFVMTIYRKLAASSIAAIEVALGRRLESLRSELESSVETGDPEDVDQRYFGEWEEGIRTGRREFFEGEMEAVRVLLRAAGNLRSSDSKLRTFLDRLVSGLLSQSPSEKVLIFTEYRTTQDYLTKALSERFGEGAVTTINGSQSLDQRSESIERFEDGAQFLVSTEAGGEGLNLHRRCHVMVNYDLPWNPMRLVQRVGRLYRYGQKNRVIVFHMHAPQTIDSEVLAILYQRIDRIVADMASVSEEYTDALQDDILGELADCLDVDDILLEASQQGIERTTDRIEEALQKAKDAVEMHRDLFSHAAGFNPDETRGEFEIDDRHVRAFVEGMLRVLGIEVVDRLYDGRVLDLRLPDEMVDELGTGRSRIRLSFDRELASRRKDVQVADFRSPLFLFLVEKARSYAFGGHCASVSYPTAGSRALFAARLRWQNDQGARMRDEFAAIEISETGWRRNPPEFSEWLLTAADTGSGSSEAAPARPSITSDAIEEAKLLLERTRDGLDERLDKVSKPELHPDSRQLIAAAWVGQDQEVAR